MMIRQILKYKKEGFTLHQSIRLYMVAKKYNKDDVKLSNAWKFYLKFKNKNKRGVKYYEN